MIRRELVICLMILSISFGTAITGCDAADDNMSPTSESDDLSLSSSGQALKSDGVITAEDGETTATTVCESGVNNGPLPDGCTKIEGGQIGQEALVVNIDGVAVNMDSWVVKDGEDGEFVGFEYTVGGAEICVAVKSGGDISVAEGDGSWVNPNGTAGPQAHAISNVVFCLSNIDDTDGDTEDGDLDDSEDDGDDSDGDDSDGDNSDSDDSDGDESDGDDSDGTISYE